VEFPTLPCTSPSQDVRMVCSHHELCSIQISPETEENDYDKELENKQYVKFEVNVNKEEYTDVSTSSRTV
jgi:hypothetical protein